MTFTISFVALIGFFVNNVYGKGCLSFDNYTFDKVVSRFDATLVKFDSAFPFGAKHEAFESVCEDSFSFPDLIVGEVQVKDYGEKENEDLAKKFGVEKDNFPTVKLFMKDKESVTFEESDSFPFTAVNLKKFVRTNAKIYIGLPGCIKDFDLIAKQFVAAKTEVEQKKVLKEAELKKNELKSEKEKKSADTYIKLMKKVIEKGTSFITTETTRVENVMKGKLNKDKVQEMQERINILDSFSTKHDEL